MKKFFKSLAVLLALTLIVGVIPASAADDATLSMAKSKTLYIGGSQGAKEDGTECKIGAKKYISKMIKNFSADTMTITAESADETVAKVNKANRIIAKGIGTTTVKVAVFDADDAKLFAQDLKVVVKKNADAVTVTGIADGDSFKVGQTVDITLPRAGVDTDARELAVDNAEVVELKTGEKARTWTAKFLKAGDAKFTATAYQSKAYPKATQTAEINVKAVLPVATGATQTAGDVVTISFEDEAGEIYTKDDYDIYYENSVGAKIRDKVIKSVVFNKENNTAAVTVYSPFTAKTVYKVAVGDSVVDFTGKSNTIADINRFEIVESSAVIGEFRELTFKFYDVDDMQLNVAPTVTLEKVSGDATVTGNKIFFDKAGNSAVVKAYYSTFDANYDEVKNYCPEKTIVGVDEYTGAEFVGYSVLTDAEKAFKETDTAIHSLKMPEKGYFRLVLKKYDNKANKYTYDYLKNLASGYSIESANEKIFVVSDKANWEITPISAGTGVLVLKKDDKVVDAFEITVDAKRYFSSVDVKVKDETLTLGSLTAKATLEYTFYDQYTDKMAVAPSVTIDSKGSDKIDSVSDGTITPVADNKFTQDITITMKSDIEDDKEYEVVIVIKTKQTDGAKADIEKRIPVKVCNVTKDPNTYSFTGAENFDLALTNDSKADNINKVISLKFNKCYGNYELGEQTAAFVAEAPKTESINVTTPAATKFVYTITKDGQKVTATGDGLDVDALTFDMYRGTTELTKIAKGTYVVTAYKISETNTVKTAVSVATAVINITDSQINAVATQNKEQTDAESAAAVFTDAFTVKFNNADLPTGSSVTGVEGQQDMTSKAWVITGAKVIIPVKDTPYTFKVDINGLPAVVK